MVPLGDDNQYALIRSHGRSSAAARTRLEEHRFGFIFLDMFFVMAPCDGFVPAGFRALGPPGRRLGILCREREREKFPSLAR